MCFRWKVSYCLDPTNPLRLTNVTVTYNGVEAVPTAVADFLPPILRRLTIYVDPGLYRVNEPTAAA